MENSPQVLGNGKAIWRIQVYISTAHVFRDFCRHLKREMPRAQSPLPAHCRRQLPGEKPLWERPVFWAGRPLSNTRGIRGSCSRKIPIERRRRDTKALRDLSYGDIGISEHRLGGLDVILSEFRRTTAGTAKTPGSGQTRLSTLPDQAALEFRQRATDSGCFAFDSDLRG